MNRDPWGGSWPTRDWLSQFWCWSLEPGNVCFHKSPRDPDTQLCLRVIAWVPYWTVASYLHLISPRNGRTSHLAQSGVGDCGCTFWVSLFILASGMLAWWDPKRHLASLQPIFCFRAEGSLTCSVTWQFPSKSLPLLIIIATRNQHVMPEKEPFRHVSIDLK